MLFSDQQRERWSAASGQGSSRGDIHHFLLDSRERGNSARPVGGRQRGHVGGCRQLESKTDQDVWEEDEEKKNRWRKTGSIWDHEKCKMTRISLQFNAVKIFWFLRWNINSLKSPITTKPLRKMLMTVISPWWSEIRSAGTTIKK